MWRHLWLIFVTLFFVTMNALLWRSEFGSQHVLGSTVRTEVVLERMLKSSDASDLEIRHKGIKIGRCRWTTTLVEPMRSPKEEALLPEGMTDRVLGYNLDLDGSLLLKNPARIRFNFRLALGTNYGWNSLFMRVLVYPRGQTRPIEVEARANTEDDPLRLRPPIFSEGDRRGEEVIPLQDLRDPDKFLSRFGGPALPALLTTLGIPLKQLATAPGAPGVEWQALKGHRVPLGRSLISVYRLHARLLDRYPINVYVTEGGEIFRVELPNDVTLVNERILAL